MVSFIYQRRQLWLGVFLLLSVGLRLCRVLMIQI